jgi:hypothetical protein
MRMEINPVSETSFSVVFMIPDYGQSPEKPVILRESHYRIDGFEAG